MGGKDSVSGPSSDIKQTKLIVKELLHVFSDLKISTMLDIPCGDFHWMKTMNLSDIDYTGADIVEKLIKENTRQYAKDGVHFEKLNIIEDKLPKVDLLFCRDCLVHFSFEAIFKAFNNIIDSQSKYICTTTFTERIDNSDIVTGEWRTLNMECLPFTLPTPLKIINEGCTKDDGFWKDKSLGLWEIADMRESLIKK